MIFDILIDFRECFNQGSSLMTFKSKGILQKLFTEVIPYLNADIDTADKWFGGIFTNDYGLIQSTASGEYL